MKFAMSTEKEVAATPESWRWIDRCPSCGHSDQSDRGRPSRKKYSFGSNTIAIPDAMRLVSCRRCSLIYKTHVPAPEWLLTLTAGSDEELWQIPHQFVEELSHIRSSAPAPFSLLDVGAASGGLLQAAAPYASRCSALDIIRFGGLRISANGEFISAFLDHEHIQWQGVPYDVVTVFDVMEHLYEPTIGLRNIYSFVKPGGMVMIETGDSDAVARVDRWYYLSLFEHHIAWNERSLSTLAKNSGFDVISIQPMRTRNARTRTTIMSLLRYPAYISSPSFYHWLQQIGGFDGSMPPKPMVKDHMRVVLRRK